MDITIEKQLTADDYIDAQFLHISWRTYAPISLLMLTFFLALAYAFDPENNNSGWVIGLVAWLIWLVIFSLILPWNIKRLARKTYAQQKSLNVPYEYRITDDMLYSHSEMGDVRLKWADLYKWKANKKLITVYPSDRIFFMFPRRCFASEEQYEDFKKLLTKTIGPIGKDRKAT